MKYIMLEFRLGVKVPIIFPESLDHEAVAMALITGIPSLCGGVVSAGFVGIHKVSLMTGGSKALGVGPNIGDDLEIMSQDHWAHTPLVEIPDSELEILQSQQGSNKVTIDDVAANAKSKFSEEVRYDS